MRASLLRTLVQTAPFALVITLGASRDAHATNITEFPDNGSEQMGRGGAWVARASDPLAVAFNPAGLAGQRTALTLQANLTLKSSCYTRLKAADERLNLAFDSTQTGAYEWNVETDAVYCTPSIWKLTGYDPADMPTTGQGWLNLLHGDDLEQVGSQHIGEQVRLADAQPHHPDAQLRRRHDVRSASGRYLTR